MATGYGHKQNEPYNYPDQHKTITLSAEIHQTNHQAATVNLFVA